MRNTGIDIPTEAQPKPIEFGFRVNSSGKSMAMALGSCRCLVLAQGGRIWIEHWQGALFFCTLPIIVPAMREAQRTSLTT